MVTKVARAAGGLADPTVFPWLVWMTVGSAAQRQEVARQVAIRVEGLLPPTPTDVIAGFLRGWSLLGMSSARPDIPAARFQWLAHETHSVLTAEAKHIPTRLRRLHRTSAFEVRFGEDFAEVVEACRRTDWTWITDDIVLLYRQLNELGLATCIGVYQEGELVGGMFGLEVGRVFSSMSVFHRVDRAGSMAWVALTEQVGPEGRWDLVQLGPTKAQHQRFGAREITEDELKQRLLENYLAHPPVRRHDPRLGSLDATGPVSSG